MNDPLFAGLLGALFILSGYGVIFYVGYVYYLAHREKCEEINRFKRNLRKLDEGEDPEEYLDGYGSLDEIIEINIRIEKALIK